MVNILDVSEILSNICNIFVDKSHIKQKLVYKWFFGQLFSQITRTDKEVL